MIGTVRFNLRSDKVLKDGRCPIHMIYSISGVRTVYNTKLACLEVYWNKDEQLVQSANKTLTKEYSTNVLLNKVEIDEMNNDLNLLKAKVLSIEREFHNKEISSKLVIDRLKDLANPKVVRSEPRNLIYDFIDKYIEENRQTRVAGSLKVYGTLKNHLKGFEEYRKQRVTFDEIDYNFFQEFQSYLFQKERIVAGEIKKLFNSTIAKQLKTLKTFLSYARKSGIIVDRSYEDFKSQRDEKDVVALTQDEFDLLLSCDLSSNNRLDKVRDIFCFSCSTGLRWSDIENLDWHNIKGKDIRITVHKTREKLIVPLNTVSYNILLRYKELNSIKPLPTISSQNFNIYIKELCEMVGIDSLIEIVRNRGAERIEEVYPKWQLISAHTGRKTFVTLSLAKGVTAEYIMRITGHKDYKSFKRYIDIAEDSKRNAIVDAWGKPEGNFSLKIV